MMRFAHPSYRLVVTAVVAAAAVLGARPLFASSPSARSPVPVGFVRNVDAQQSLVYISSRSNNLIAVFDRNGASVGTITSGLNSPEGLFVDKHHNLWVANYGASNVLKFPRGASMPSETLGGAGFPGDVSMCPDGTIYAANLGGNVAVYRHHGRTPARFLTFGAADPWFLTCDATGNVFASVLYGTCSTVVEFPGGREAGATLLPIGTCGNPGGIKPDSAGNLLYSTEEGSVAEYTEKGKPTGTSIAVPLGWTDIAVDRKGNAVLGAVGNTGSSFAFPGGQPLYTFENTNLGGDATGVAFDPDQP
jgi:hypothetical protein